jgi:hypothetical protein
MTAFMTVHQHTPSSSESWDTGRAFSPTWRHASTPARRVSTRLRVDVFRGLGPRPRRTPRLAATPPPVLRVAVAAIRACRRGRFSGWSERAGVGAEPGGRLMVHDQVGLRVRRPLPTRRAAGWPARGRRRRRSRRPTGRLIAGAVTVGLVAAASVWLYTLNRPDGDAVAPTMTSAGASTAAPRVRVPDAASPGSTPHPKSP